MIKSFRTALVFGALAFAGVTPGALVPASAASNAVTKIVLTPSGATLKPGDTVTFSAQAFNKAGQLIPDARLTFTSAPTSILSVTSAGAATAKATGIATLTVKAGAKSLKTQIAVVPATGQKYTAVTGKVQINHIVTDDNWIYWTEADNVQTRLRKTAKTGGPIYDLASEAARDNRGVALAYAQIRQIGDTLYFSRQAVGFAEHWSIFSVPKAGGAKTQVLAEDISIQSMTASGWQASGKYLVVAMRNAPKVGLTANTVAAAYDTQTQQWTSLVRGSYLSNSYYITAADDHYAYFRGENSSFDTKVLRVDPSAGENTFTTLETYPQRDIQLDQPGTSDGNNLFVWSTRANTPKLLCYPVTGGDPVVVESGNYGTGLTTDGTFLYWARNRTTLVRLLNAGGTPTVVAQNLLANSTAASIAIDGNVAYIAGFLSSKNVVIVPVAR